MFRGVSVVNLRLIFGYAPLYEVPPLLHHDGIICTGYKYVALATTI